MLTLYNLKINQSGIIKNIKLPNNISERLHSVGFIEGITIKYIGQAPLGSPRIYKCLNTKIAIRSKTAKQIEIEIL